MRRCPREVRRWCRSEPAADGLLREAVARLGLSARAYHRVLKIARTIADLAGADEVGADHVAEAIQYRSLDPAPPEGRCLTRPAIAPAPPKVVCSGAMSWSTRRASRTPQVVAFGCGRCAVRGPPSLGSSLEPHAGSPAVTRRTSERSIHDERK
ncbi:MAG: hypothetical protein ACREOC_06040 [Gemmatimonadales bacterium]